MKSYTAAEASKKFGEALKAADAAPVEITRYGGRAKKPARYVLMSHSVFKAYEIIRRAHADDRVLLTMQTAVDKLLKEENETGFKVLRLGNALMKRFQDATGEKL